MKKVLILGARGMLGGMLYRILAPDPCLDLHAAYRDAYIPSPGEMDFPDSILHSIDLAAASDDNLRQLLHGCAWVINAAGLIKQRIRENDQGDIDQAIQINALLPRRLARLTAGTETQILQIATDCVFSGREGGCDECSPHDPLDIYGATKNLGEVRADHVHHLRCSIIGPDPRKRVSLLEWFLSEPPGATVPGFRNHYWNGITTYHFARICLGIIQTDAKPPGLQHVIPAGGVKKFDLLRIIAQAYGRQDIEIDGIDAPRAVDRTLSTNNPIANRRLWEIGGFGRPLNTCEMLQELAEAEPRLGYPLRKGAS